MVVKKKSDKSLKRSTSMAMSDVLKRQKRGAKAIERIVDENIAREISTTKTEPASAEKKGAADGKKKAPGATAKKAERPISARKPALRKPAVKARRDGRVSVEVVTLGAGLFKVADAAVGGFLNAGKAVARFAGSPARGARSVESEASVKPQHKKADAGPVLSALATASKVTGKVAGGAATLGAGAGKAAGYVITGALSAPVDIINGVIGIGASATGFTSRLLFGPPNRKVQSRKNEGESG